jgi:hypothetical protein
MKRSKTLKTVRNGERLETLESERINALERIVENGHVNGRSHYFI